MLDIALLIADDVAGAAEWRWRKAAEFPHDGERNSKAAEMLERIGSELRQGHGSHWHWRLQGACNRNPERYSEILSQLVRSVGLAHRQAMPMSLSASCCFSSNPSSQSGAARSFRFAASRLGLTT
jgi:hypothetical protein